MEKDPNARWQTAEALGDALKRLPDFTSPPLDASGKRRGLRILIIAASAIILVAIGIVSSFKLPGTRGLIVPGAQFSIPSPDGQNKFSGLLVSPDGKWIAFFNDKLDRTHCG
jgi:hypothetical protein